MGTLSSLYSELALSSPMDIRLVILHPALEQEAPLWCDLDGTSLDDAPEFEALSYVWETPLGIPLQYAQDSKPLLQTTLRMHFDAYVIRLGIGFSG